MKSSLLSFLLGVALSLPVFANAASPAGLVRDANDLGTATWTEWVNGAAKELDNRDARGVAEPFRYLWSKRTPIDYVPLLYGASKTPGVRYLGIGFKTPVTIGSILARGGGQVSVLKPGIAYPGDLADPSEWIPAQRLEAGQVTDAEVGPDDEVVWTLPAVVTTRAIRFTHVAQPSDPSYAGSLGGIAILPGRWANLAPQALAERLRAVNTLFPPNNGYEFAIRYRRRA